MVEWNTTIVVLFAATGLAIFANWQSRLPFHRRWLKVTPWMGVQFLACVVALVMLAHLASLATGKPFGRNY